MSEEEAMATEKVSSASALDPKQLAKARETLVALSSVIGRGGRSEEAESRSSA